MSFFGRQRTHGSSPQNGIFPELQPQTSDVFWKLREAQRQKPASAALTAQQRVQLSPFEQQFAQIDQAADADFQQHVSTSNHADLVYEAELMISDLTANDHLYDAMQLMLAVSRSQQQLRLSAPAATTARAAYELACSQRDWLQDHFHHHSDAEIEAAARPKDMPEFGSPEAATAIQTFEKTADPHRLRYAMGANGYATPERLAFVAVEKVAEYHLAGQAAHAEAIRKRSYANINQLRSDAAGVWFNALRQQPGRLDRATQQRVQTTLKAVWNLSPVMRVQDVLHTCYYGHRLLQKRGRFGHRHGHRNRAATMSSYSYFNSASHEYGFHPTTGLAGREQHWKTMSHAMLVGFSFNKSARFTD